MKGYKKKAEDIIGAETTISRTNGLIKDRRRESHNNPTNIDTSE
jgi:hypothetical protein